MSVLVVLIVEKQAGYTETALLFKLIYRWSDKFIVRKGGRPCIPLKELTIEESTPVEKYWLQSRIC